jgi:hypothetical protein
MKTEEVLVFAAKVAARNAWANKTSRCIVDKNPAEGQSAIFQRRNLVHKMEEDRLILWKEGEEERKFQIIIPKNLSLNIMAELVMKTMKASSRLWEAKILGFWLDEDDERYSYRSHLWEQEEYEWIHIIRIIFRFSGQNKDQNLVLYQNGEWYIKEKS